MTPRRFPVLSVVLSAGFLLAFLVAAAATSRWVLAAAPVGFLLGFVLSKGELCGASAFSEVLLMRDRRRLFGIWTAAATSMVVFAVLDGLGLVTLCPRPLFAVAYAVGGAVFGVGMVLAGGCVSGTLYKCGIGHANSMVALLVMPFGIQAVDFGFLSGVDRALRRVVIDGRGGAPASLPSLTGVPFAVLAGAFAVGTVLFAIRARSRRQPPSGAVRRAPTEPWWRRAIMRPWKPWQAGVLVGILAAPGWLTSLEGGRDFPLCVTYGVEEVPLLLTGGSPVWIDSPSDVTEFAAGPAEAKRIYLWLLLVVGSLVLGAHAAARMSGTARFHPRPPGQLVAAAIGGFLVGVGAGLGRGCILGNGMMGAALMSFGMVLFAVAAFAANLVTTRLWVMGLR